MGSRKFPERVKWETDAKTLPSAKEGLEQGEIQEKYVPSLKAKRLRKGGRREEGDKDSVEIGGGGNDPNWGSQQEV